MITLELVENLSTAEWEELKRFIEFRYPRMRTDVLRLVEELKTRSGKLNSVTRKHMHQWLYSGSTFNDKVIRYLTTDLNKAIYAYLSYKQLLKRPQQQHSLLLEELASRQCSRAFNKTYNEEIRAMESLGSVDVNALHHKYELHSLKAKSELEAGKRSSDVFEDSSRYLDHYFVAKKLQISAEKINLNYILKKEWNDPFLSTILEQIDQGLFKSSPYIQLYRLIIKSLTEPENESVFDQLQQQIPKLIGRLPDSELSDLFQYLLNYCIRRINAGQLIFQERLLSVYQLALKHGALLNEGRISQWDFKNVVTISLRTKELDYAREFIHSYKPALAQEQRTNALAYNLANLHFAEGDFKAAIKQLQKVDLDDVYYRLDARSILLKSYFELDDTDALHYHATAFRSLLNRNRKISDQQRKLYLNLIKHTLSLSRADGETAKVLQIKARIESDPNVADLNWLEAKLSA